MKILGVDPSLRATGYGIVEVAGPELRPIAHGVIENPPKLLPSRCLVRIADALRELIQRYQPAAMAIEGLVYVQNTRIAFTLGEVRGVALATAAAHGLDIFEYAPRKVKQSVTGRGGAGKTQVAQMVKAQLGLAELPDADAADALALALCHAAQLRSVALSPPRPI